MRTLERADIERVTYGGHDSNVTEVRGYQNYDITDLTVQAISNPGEKRPWTDTLVKSRDFTDIFHKISPGSYADFGCNLGYYVFLCAQEFDIPAVGVDYNQEYIGVCTSIAARHTAALATFKRRDLKTWATERDRFDFLTVFNVIHHLYNRTEQYRDMGLLLMDFSLKADVIMFEVPTEKDKKGHKWTMDTGYSEELFVQCAEELFNRVDRIPGQTEHRPYYVCYS